PGSRFGSHLMQIGGELHGRAMSPGAMMKAGAPLASQFASIEQVWPWESLAVPPITPVFDRPTTHSQPPSSSLELLPEPLEPESLPESLSDELPDSLSEPDELVDDEPLELSESL